MTHSPGPPPDDRAPEPTQIRLLAGDDSLGVAGAWLAGRGAEPGALTRAYTAGRRRWLRANFVTSVDGAIAVRGRSRGLQVPADMAVFTTLRCQADAVLVGAGTARAEEYGGVRLSARCRSERETRGQSPVPALVVVSNRGELDADSRLVREATGPVILVCPAGTSAPAGTVELLRVGGTTVDLAAALAALRERGLHELVCEGGPTLFAGLAAAGLVDELCLTLSPLLAGPGAGRLSGGAQWTGSRRLRPCLIASGDGALLVRYLLR